MDEEEVEEYIEQVHKIRKGLSKKENLRECYVCGERIVWLFFALPPFTEDRKDMLENFGFDLLLEIWLNPIFVIKCCWCFAGVPNPNVIRENERQANWRSL